MESLLWALDLLGVAYLCFWALREDKKSAADAKAQRQRKPGGGQG